MAMIKFLSNLDEYVFYNLRIYDVFDIIFFSFFIFYLLGWVKKKFTPSLLASLVSVTLIYSFSKAFDLYLIDLLFKLAFSALFLIVIVVFQDDLRRILSDIINSFRFNSRFNKNLQSIEIDQLVEIVSELADRKIGALFVLKGRDSLSSFVNGGNKLQSTINKPLIYSLFNDETPGHDGAMIIESGHIVEFAAHLPLSKNRKLLKDLGTRHSAALGISEKVDAFTIIVSEETGRISITRLSRLRYNIGASELKSQLEDFFLYLSPRRKKLSWRMSLSTTGMFFVSLLISLIVWSSVTYDPGIVFETLTFPVEFQNLDSDLDIDYLSTNQVQVTLAGPSKVIEKITPEQRRVLLNFSNIQPGQALYEKSQFDFDLPARVKIHKVSPQQISATVVKIKTMEVSLKPRLIGTVPPNLYISEIRTIPQKVKLIMRYNKTIREGFLQTEPIDLSALTKGRHVLDVGVEVPAQTRLEKVSLDKVEVTLIVKEKK